MSPVDDLLLHGDAIDAILVAMALEAGALLAYHRRTGRGVPPRGWIANLLAGAALLLALRFAITPMASPWIPVFLGLGLLAHLADLALRWEGSAAPRK
jgi:hypothetical protein